MAGLHPDDQAAGQRLPSVTSAPAAPPAAAGAGSFTAGPGSFTAGLVGKAPAQGHQAAAPAVAGGLGHAGLRGTQSDSSAYPPGSSAAAAAAAGAGQRGPLYPSVTP